MSWTLCFSQSADINCHKAYFEDSANAIFGMLIRSTFEVRLRKHFRHTQNHSSQMEDPAWFALRNTVYAIGCRCLLANSTTLTFEQAEGKAWQLFCNALSVFGELIFSHSGLTAIQALATMVGCTSLTQLGICIPDH